MFHYVGFGLIVANFLILLKPICWLLVDTNFELPWVNECPGLFLIMKK